MRQLRMPLRVDAPSPAARPTTPPPDSGGVVQWAASVRGSAQACLLVSMDGVVIAVSEPAQRLLGAGARPGVAVEECWRELSMQVGEPPPQTSLLSRTISTGSPAHSVLSLDLPAGPTTMQVMAAPLQVAGVPAVALLAFLWPMATQSGYSSVRVP
jgi:hypothetical protein